MPPVAIRRLAADCRVGGAPLPVFIGISFSPLNRPWRLRFRVRLYIPSSHDRTALCLPIRPQRLVQDIDLGEIQAELFMEDFILLAARRSFLLLNNPIIISP